MSDIRCVVCGEPWDAYGVRHGDMLKWEADLFRKGAGCPSCEGTPPEGGYEPKTIFDIENGDEDPMLRILAREAHEEGSAPKWERPKDVLVWSCDDCGVEVRRDADDDALVYVAPYKSRASYEYWHRNEDAPEKPEHSFEIAKDTFLHVCEKCYTTCEECGEPVCPGDDNGSFPHPANDSYEYKVVCGEDCLSKAEDEEAQRVWKECYSPEERIAYMRRHKSQFDCLYKGQGATAFCMRWRDILANVRGTYFSGYASELVRP